MGGQKILRGQIARLQSAALDQQILHTAGDAISAQQTHHGSDTIAKDL